MQIFLEEFLVTPDLNLIVWVLGVFLKNILHAFSF